MKLEHNVVAAISAALQLYMQTEQQQPAILVEREKKPAMPGPVYSPWVMAGRQAMMETRRMWQMRLAR